ncbi:MAG TPA: 2OG-Fe(II) oxygenase [Sulfurimonas sp.]|nr:2OG-Fe(II) oxygenase [Sulfurimonas sp.]
MNSLIYEKVLVGLIENGYIVLKEALSKEMQNSLYKIAVNTNMYKQAGISSSNEKHIDNSKRRDKILWLDKDGSSVDEYLDFCEGLSGYLNRELYLGLNSYEAHFACYEEGDFYEKHLDSFSKNNTRIVTTVFYLNPEYKDSDGGNLVMYDKKANKLLSVAPKGGTLVVFLSDKFPHEVLPTYKKRYSIAGWFRSDVR